MGLCGEKCCFHGRGRFCLLYSQSAHPVPLLLGPVVRSISASAIATSAAPLYKISRNDFFAFSRLSDYKQTLIKDEDDDVAAERQRIYEGGSKTDILHIRDLSKVKKEEDLYVSVTSS